MALGEETVRGVTEIILDVKNAKKKCLVLLEYCFIRK